MKKWIVALTLVTGFRAAECQIIDMHMHSYTEKDFWTGTARNGLASSKSLQEHLSQTIEKMNKHNIRYAVISGTIESLEKYTKAEKRLITRKKNYKDNLIQIKKFEEYKKKGKIKVFGEVMAVYKGKKLT